MRQEVTRQTLYELFSQIDHRLRVRLYDERLECLLNDPMCRLFRVGAFQRAGLIAVDAATWLIIVTSSMPCAVNRWRCSTWSTATSCSHVTHSAMPGTGWLPPSRRAMPVAPWSVCWRWRTIAPVEAELATALDAILDAGEVPDLTALQRRFMPTPSPM